MSEVSGNYATLVGGQVVIVRIPSKGELVKGVGRGTLVTQSTVKPYDQQVIPYLIGDGVSTFQIWLIQHELPFDEWLLRMMAESWIEEKGDSMMEILSNLENIMNGKDQKWHVGWVKITHDEGLYIWFEQKEELNGPRKRPRRGSERIRLDLSKMPEIAFQINKESPIQQPPSEKVLYKLTNDKKLGREQILGFWKDGAGSTIYRVYSKMDPETKEMRHGYYQTVETYEDGVDLLVKNL